MAAILEETGLSQRDVAKVLGISRSLVCYFEQRAIEKLKAAIVADAEASGLSLDAWLEGEGTEKRNP